MKTSKLILKDNSKFILNPSDVQRMIDGKMFLKADSQEIGMMKGAKKQQIITSEISGVVVCS